MFEVTSLSLMNTTQHETPVVQKYSAFFLFDFIGRYAVDRCGAEDTLFVAFLSWVCILPYWVWTSTVVLMLTRVELYWAMAKYTISLLTICAILLLILFDTPPPVLGCGPDQSFPSPQTALSAYAATTFFYYIELRPTAQRDSQLWLQTLMVGNLVAVTLGLLWLGMASTTSVIAGTLLGSLIAALLHEVLLNLSEDQGNITKFVLFLENKLGIHTVDTLLSAIGKIVDGREAMEATFSAPSSNEGLFNMNDSSSEQSTEYTPIVRQSKPIEYTPLTQLEHPDREVVAIAKS